LRVLEDEGRTELAARLAQMHRDGALVREAELIALLRSLAREEK
jgi:hypothetical protein